MPAILIVDDSPDNIRLFQAVLTMKGHQVTALAGGEELFSTLAKSRPDLVLMDVQMPGKDGFALLAELRASDFRDQPVVALTANAMVGDMERAISAGFDGYISKPIDIRKFPDQVASVLSAVRSPAPTAS